MRYRRGPERPRRKGFELLSLRVPKPSGEASEYEWHCSNSAVVRPPVVQRHGWRVHTLKRQYHAMQEPVQQQSWADCTCYIAVASRNAAVPDNHDAKDGGHAHAPSGQSRFPTSPLHRVGARADLLPQPSNTRSCDKSAFEAHPIMPARPTTARGAGTSVGKRLWSLARRWCARPCEEEEEEEDEEHGASMRRARRATMMRVPTRTITLESPWQDQCLSPSQAAQVHKKTEGQRTRT